MSIQENEKRLDRIAEGMGFKKVKHIQSKWCKNRIFSDLTARSLDDVYGTYSQKKYIAFLTCKNYYNTLGQNDIDVYNFRISSAGSSYFSVQFNADIGAKKYLFEITVGHKYYCCLTN